MEKKKVTCKDLEGLRQLFPENSRERVLSAEEPGVGMPAPANAPYPGGYYGGDGYGSSGIGGNGYYGYDEEGYIIDGGELPEIVVYGYYYGGKDKDEEKEEEDDKDTPNPGTDIPFFPGIGGGGGGEDIEDGYPEIPDKSGDGYPGYPYDPYDPYYMEYGNAYGEDSGGSGPDPRKNGVDVTNSKHFTFNTDANPAFHKQLIKILESNSVLKFFLGYFDKGYVHMTFEAKDIGSAYAHTTYNDNRTTYYIRFNTKYMNENGWDGPTDRIDAIGYDWSKVNTKEEGMLVSLMHEAMHANHFARYYDAVIACNDYGKAREYLLANGYSEEFVNVFFEKGEDGNWTERKDNEDLMHAYIRDHDLQYIDEALAEYRNDFKN